MKGSLVIEDRDLGLKALGQRMHDNYDHVDIGIHADESELLVKIAAAHEFGATIHHPGGTAYGFATKEDAKRHRITFLKGGSGYKVLGVTRPHVIILPMRSFIRSTMDRQAERYQQLAARLLGMIVDAKMDRYGALSVLGQQIESDIKRTIVTMKEPPLKAATIARKGSSSLLQDKGHLKGGIRYIVKERGSDASTKPITGK